MASQQDILNLQYVGKLRVAVGRRQIEPTEVPRRDLLLFPSIDATCSILTYAPVEQGFTTMPCSDVFD